MTKHLAFVLGISLFVGCGMDKANDGIETLADLIVPPKPEVGQGLQVITPIFEPVMPSTDYEVCTWTDTILTEPVDIKATQGSQNEPPGHHVIVFYTMEHQPPGTQRICTDSDMASFRFLTGAGGEGNSISVVPGDLVFHVPAGAQLVVNHHYLNSTDQVLKGQSVINLFYADKSRSWTRASSLTVLDTKINIPPGIQTWDTHCVVDQPYKAWFAIPHMHQWGKHINISWTHADTKTSLFDLEWDPSYAFHAPNITKDPAEPMMISAGDSFDIHCEWNNDSGKTLDFGFEMCLTFASTVDTEQVGNRACDGGVWGPF
jgi:hypothetical protein